MTRILAKVIARWKYIFSQEIQAATADLHAGLSLKLAAEKRALIETLNREADEIEANIKSVDEKLGAGYWECENRHDSTSQPSAIVDVLHDPHCPNCGKQMKLVKRDLMTGQENYESDKERKEAEQIAASKRAQAKAEEETPGSHRCTAYFVSFM